MFIKDKKSPNTSKKSLNIKKIWKNNWFIISLSFKAAPVFMIYMIFEQIKQAGLVFLEHTYGIHFVLEAAEYGKPFILVVRFLFIVLASWAISFIFSGIYQNYVSQKGLLKIQKRLKEIIYDKVKDIDLECYDNPEYYNNFVLAISEAEQSINRAHKILETTAYGITILITSGIFFLTIDAVSVLFVVGSFILSFFFTKYMNKLNYKNRIEKNPIERKRSYVHRVFYLNEYAKELRLNPDIFLRLNDEFDDTNKEIQMIEKKYAPKRTILQFIIQYISNYFTVDVVYIIYLVYRAAVMRAISYSSVVVLWNSQGHLKRSLRNFATVLPQLSENSLYIEKIQDFLRYERKIISRQNLPLPKEPKVLEIKNISFAYSEKDGSILNNISLTIHPNEKAALVGYNGAGKTTLIKLIMRLYDPCEGEILYDGINIKDYDLNGYRDAIGTIFQDFKIFAATVEENVFLDENNIFKSTSDEEGEEQRIIDALTYSGFKDKLEQLPKGLKTELTTEFEEDGRELSGGENQKLAIARAFYKDAGMVILDEPSSALDPIAEYQLNEAMLRAAAHKTVIFISHRLSTTRNADRIFMLEHGCIIEEGSHEELLDMDEKYAQMWKAQAGKYINLKN
ncbi:MAG: ABC transporter ATP-binding protein [Clostridiales bacterium]|jgi:ATP-binding cassette subfamily B protein|nr:ABC transporter ATP-binding protein [Clostridiales bacterium]